MRSGMLFSIKLNPREVHHSTSYTITQPRSRQSEYKSITSPTITQSTHHTEEYASRAQEYYQPHKSITSPTKVLPDPQKYYQTHKVSGRATTSGGWVVVMPVSQPII